METRAEFSGSEEPSVTCVTCGQSMPLEQPCTTGSCVLKTASDIRVAAEKASFRLGC